MGTFSRSSWNEKEGCGGRWGGGGSSACFAIFFGTDLLSACVLPATQTEVYVKCSRNQLAHRSGSLAYRPGEGKEIRYEGTKADRVTAQKSPTESIHSRHFFIFYAVPTNGRL